MHAPRAYIVTESVVDVASKLKSCVHAALHGSLHTKYIVNIMQPYLHSLNLRPNNQLSKTFFAMTDSLYFRVCNKWHLMQILCFLIMSL